MTQREIERRDHWANQLCTPEWMVSIPTDLNGAGSRLGAGGKIALMQSMETKNCVASSSRELGTSLMSLESRSAEP